MKREIIIVVRRVDINYYKYLASSKEEAEAMYENGEEPFDSDIGDGDEEIAEVWDPEWEKMEREAHKLLEEENEEKTQNKV
jgi:hypothetical protein